MTRARHSVVDSLRLVGVQGATSLAGILFLLLAARWMTGVELASLAVWEILVGATRVIASLGVVGTLTQRVPVAIASGDLPLVRGYMRLGLISQACLAVPVVVGIALAAAPLSALFFDSTEHVRLVWLLAGATLAGRLYDQVSMLLSPLDRFRVMSGCRLAHDVVLRLVAVAVYPLGGMAAFFGVIGVGELAISVAAIVAVRRHVFGPAVRVPIRRVLRYSVPFYLNGFLRFGVMQVDQVAVSALLGPHALATYFVARRLYFFLESLVNHLVAPIIPKLSAVRAAGPERLERAFCRAGRLLVAALVPPALYVALLSGVLVDLVGDGAYAEAGPILAALALVALLFGVAQLYATLIFVAARPGVTLKLNAIAGVASVASVLVLGTTLGMWGIVLAKILGLVVWIGAGHVMCRTIVRLRFDGVAAARVLAVTGLGALPLAWSLVSGWHEPITVPVGLAVSLAVSAWLLTRVLRAEDLELLRASVPERVRPLVGRVLPEAPAKAA